MVPRLPLVSVLATVTWPPVIVSVPVPDCPIERLAKLVQLPSETVTLPELFAL